MSFRLYIKLFLITVFFLFFGVILFNRLIDPMGIYTSDEKFLHIENKAIPEYVSLKIFSDNYDYGIVGTSRSQKLDHNYTSKYGIKSKNLSISASSIKINEEIIKNLKELNKNFILFFDVYSLSKENYEHNFKKIYKLNIIKNETKQIKKSRFYRHFKYLVSKDTFGYSIETFFNKIKKKDKFFFWRDETKNKKYEKGTAFKYINSDYFNPYVIDYKFLKNFKKYISKNDYIIISPSFYEIYYQMYKKGILEEYFKSIELLLETDAQIISFLVPGEFIYNSNIYDDGIHYRYFHGDEIIDDIFTKNKKISVKLTKENFENYKRNLYKWFDEKGSLDENLN